MWSDNETDVDLLGFRVHSQLIKSVVLDPGLLPVTLGVFGDWGSGKSSVIRMLQKSIEEEENVACIYFNGWQFEGYDDAKSALIYSILLELAKHQKLGPKVREKVKNILTKINWLRVFKVGYQTIAAPMLVAQLTQHMGLPPGPVVPSIDPDTLKNIDPEELVKQDPANQALVGARQFREDFADLIQETGLSSLVILIDDIDRCEPQRLVETLEAIKLFLSVPHMAFVIGADERIVRYAIARRYETRGIEASERQGSNQVDLVTDYLEKLIQIPYYLPRLSASEIETYISLLFCQLRLGNDFKHVHDAFLDTRQTDITRVYRHEDIREALQQCNIGCPNQLTDELAWCSSISLTLSDLLKGNPRQTKRLLNALLLRKRLAEAARIELSDQVLAKLMILEYLQPELFAQLYRWQSVQGGTAKELEVLESDPQTDDETAKSIDEICKSQPNWRLPAVQTWLHMPPPLAKQDLRNYFWITRDRITGILSGVAAIPLHLRKLLEDLLDTGDSNILNETRSQIMTLSHDEKLILIDELIAYVRRDPGSQNAVGVLTRVAQILPEFIPKLITVFSEIAPVSLNRITPVWLVRLAQTAPSHQAAITRLLDKWANDDTALGIAAKEALEDLKGGR